MADKPDDVICEGDVCRRMTPEEVAARDAAAASGESAAAGPRIFSLLGKTLLGQDCAEVPVSSITGPGKVIALYFSAHWCPPCRAFTPHLASIFKRFKESHPRADDWQVVFVSSDRDEASFAEYFAEMPWLALPYSAREAKAELAKMYKIRGIPGLILVDGESGELITASGRDAVGDDETCENFPWRPKTFQQIMEGATLVEPGGATVPALERLAGKTTLLYFSASWCPPCRRFTPKLVEAVAALREAGKAVEAVFVSGDRTPEASAEYHSHMTWPALPFEDRKRNSELNMLFQVEGIPTLVVMDESFKVITDEGVGAVSSDPAGRRFPWAPQPLEPLNPGTAGRINTGPVLLLLLEGTADEEAAEVAAKAALEKVAVAVVTAQGGAGGEGKMSFLWVRSEDDMAQRVVAFAGGVKMVDGRGAVVLDVSGKQATWDLGAAGVALDEAGLEAAVADWKAAKLGPGKKLGGDDEDEEE